MKTHFPMNKRTNMIVRHMADQMGIAARRLLKPYQSGATAWKALTASDYEHLRQGADSVDCFCALLTRGFDSDDTTPFSMRIQSNLYWFEKIISNAFKEFSHAKSEMPLPSVLAVSRAYLSVTALTHQIAQTHDNVVSSPL